MGLEEDWDGGAEVATEANQMASGDSLTCMYDDMRKGDQDQAVCYHLSRNMDEWDVG